MARDFGTYHIYRKATFEAYIYSHLVGVRDLNSSVDDKADDTCLYGLERLKNVVIRKCVYEVSRLLRHNLSLGRIFCVCVSFDSLHPGNICSVMSGRVFLD